MKYKIEDIEIDSFGPEGFIVDDVRYYVYKRPWWRFWKWELVAIFELEKDANEYVRQEKIIEFFNKGE